MNPIEIAKAIYWAVRNDLKWFAEDFKSILDVLGVKR